MRYDQYVVKAYDKSGALVRRKEFTDLVAANGFATGLHAHFGYDTWINDTKIFSHVKPMQRLTPGEMAPA